MNFIFVALKNLYLIYVCIKKSTFFLRDSYNILNIHAKTLKNLKGTHDLN